MNRDFLKEAIADAKAVKESAIANAKAALEESFTPHLKSMLSTRIQEMEKEDNMKEAMRGSFEEDDVKEMMRGSFEEDDVKKEAMRNSFKEDDVKEMMRGSFEDDVKEEMRDKKDKMKKEEMSNPIMRRGLKGDNPAELETEKMRMREEELDEVLSELEESEKVNEEDKDKIKEDARTDAEEEGYLDGMKDEKEDLDNEEIDLDDMTDDDLKKFIEDVIEDMVAAGEIEAGDNFEDNVDVTVDDDGSIDVEVEDEVMSENKNNVNESEGVNEVVGTAMAGAAALVAAAGGLAKISMAMEEDPKGFAKKYPVINTVMSFMQEVGGAAGSAMRREAKEDMPSDEELSKLEDAMDKLFEAKSSYMEDDMKEEMSKKRSEDGMKEEMKYSEDDMKEEMKKDMDEEMKKDMDEEMKKDLDEAYSTIETLRSDLNEINLLNAKLLYTNKIFKSKNLNENDKVKVLTNFDKATTVKEAKLIYDTLKDLKPKAKKRSIKESIGRASKSAGLAPNKSEKKPIVESNQMVDRFKKLAGII